MRRLVQFGLPDPVGLERAADAHARRPFLHRGPLQGRQERRHLPRLFGGLQVRRSVDLGEAGHRRRARHGHGPRHPARVLPRPAGRVFRGLRPAVHRHADAGAAGEAGRRPGAGPAAARLRFPGQSRRDQQSRMEDGRLRRDVREHRRAARLGRLPLGREGQVEPRGEGSGRPRDQPAAELRRRQGRRSPTSPSPISATASTTTSPAPIIRACWCARCRPSACSSRTARRWSPRCSTCSSPTTASIAASAARTSPSPTTRTCPTRRPGPRRSPACRATRSSRSRASSPAMPRRPRAAR